MSSVYVVGAGNSRYGSFPDETYRSLFSTAFENASQSAGEEFDRSLVDEVFLGTLGVGGRQIGLSAPAATEDAGLRGVPTTRTENACAASSFAFRNAVMAVESGRADVALAGGFEVMTDTSSDQTRWWLGVSGDMEWERLSGTTFAGGFAQVASAHMDQYNTTIDDLSRISVKSHRNAAKNPDAHLQFECSVDEASGSATIADPLTLYHCCPVTDGASAAIVANEQVARELGRADVRVAGLGASTDRLGFFERDTLTSIPGTRQAAERAYEEAGIGPGAVDVAEVHDCFSIAELIAYEDLGFCDPGEGAAFIRSGGPGPDGETPVNTSGGLKAKGHPIGATGTGQIAELLAQLRGEAHVQVDSPQYALGHNVGGSGGAVAVTVLKRTAGGDVGA